MLMWAVYGLAVIGLLTLAVGVTLTALTLAARRSYGSDAE